MLRRAACCPICGSSANLASASKSNIVTCSRCNREFVQKFRFSEANIWVSFALSPVLSYAVGLRGIALLLVSLVAWVPIAIVFRLLINRILPPKLVIRDMNNEQLSVRETIRKHRQPISLNLVDKRKD